LALPSNVRCGQNGIGPDGATVPGGLDEQTAQALNNVEQVLSDAGGGLEDIAFWTIQIVQGQPIAEAFTAFQRVWGTRPNPPAISVAFVVALADPSFLIEITAIAVVDAC